MENFFYFRLGTVRSEGVDFHRFLYFSAHFVACFIHLVILFVSENLNKVKPLHGKNTDVGKIGYKSHE